MIHFFKIMIPPYKILPNSKFILNLKSEIIKVYNKERVK